MKKIILVLVFLASTGVYSQYNLEFNRVLTFKLYQNQEVAVPEGKVWKIESVTNSANTNTFQVRSLGNSGVTPANDVNINFYDAVAATVVWLKAGDILNGAYNAGTAFSIIEFNLVSTSSSSGGSATGLTSFQNFNQIIHLEYPSSCTSGSASGCHLGQMVVPDGKIWEIKKVSNYNVIINGNNSYHSSGGGTILVGGFKVPVNSEVAETTSSALFIPGSYDIYSTTSSQGGSTARFIIAEYNSN